MRQIVTAFTDLGFDGFHRAVQPRVSVVTANRYHEQFDLPVLFPPQAIRNNLGEVLSRAGLRQFRIAETEKYAHVTFFFNGGSDTDIAIDRILTDNGSGYVATAFRQACAALQLRHLRTRPYTPRTNGKAERFIQTLLREWAYVMPYATSQDRRTALRPWVRFYNRQRPHASLGYQPPLTRLQRAA
jgi:transposase InsO family protein